MVRKGIKLSFHYFDIYMMGWRKKNNWFNPNPQIEGKKKWGIGGTEWNAFQHVPFHFILF